MQLFYNIYQLLFLFENTPNPSKIISHNKLHATPNLKIPNKKKIFWIAFSARHSIIPFLPHHSSIIRDKSSSIPKTYQISLQAAEKQRNGRTTNSFGWSRSGGQVGWGGKVECQVKNDDFPPSYIYIYILKRKQRFRVQSEANHRIASTRLMLPKVNQRAHQSAEYTSTKPNTREFMFGWNNNKNMRKLKKITVEKKTKTNCSSSFRALVEWAGGGKRRWDENMRWGSSFWFSALFLLLLQYCVSHVWSESYLFFNFFFGASRF